MKNVEFKAELRDPTLAEGVCRKLGARFVATIRQVDTYYRVARGRLKKREAVILAKEGPIEEPPEIIFYERGDQLRPKVSDFTILSEEQARERYGPAPMTVWLVVRKTRKVFMLGPTRIHLDTVEDLGRFIEFESLVSGVNSLEAAQAHNESLRTALGVALGEPIAASYSDLLAGELERGGA